MYLTVVGKAVPSTNAKLVTICFLDPQSSHLSIPKYSFWKIFAKIMFFNNFLITSFNFEFETVLVYLLQIKMNHVLA